MGWSDCHLHQFECGEMLYGRPDPDLDVEQEDERRVHLGQVLSEPNDRMVYEYDFGDSWEHDVVLEAIGEAGVAKAPTRVLAGKGACPPEDVGGTTGYYQFLEAIQDSKHPEHREMLEWSGPFDPDAFDVDKVNRYFKKRPRKRSDA